MEFHFYVILPPLASLAFGGNKVKDRSNYKIRRFFATCLPQAGAQNDGELVS